MLSYISPRHGRCLVTEVARGVKSIILVLLQRLKNLLFQFRKLSKRINSVPDLDVGLHLIAVNGLVFISQIVIRITA